MDTVEWGSGRGPVEPLARQQNLGLDEPQNRRLSARIGGRWTAVTLAAVGVAAMVAAQLLPWTTLHPGSTSEGTNIESNSVGLTVTLSLGLDRLTSFGVFAYQIGTLAILGLLGALLFGSVRQRRTVFGIGAGLFAAQAVNLAGIVHSFSHLLDNYVPLGAQTGGLHTSVDPGAYFAVIGLLLLLASLLVTAAPERVRAQLSDVVREPVDAQFTDEPFELTVTQAKPIDEAYFTRPENHR
jgi:hypothetical protein